MNVLLRNTNISMYSAHQLKAEHDWQLWASNPDNVIITKDSAGTVEMVAEVSGTADPVLTDEVVQHINTRYHMGMAYVMNKAYLR